MACMLTSRWKVLVANRGHKFLPCIGSAAKLCVCVCVCVILKRESFTSRHVVNEIAAKEQNEEEKEEDRGIEKRSRLRFWREVP